MKAVSLLINSYLPEDLRDYNRTYTAKELNELMSQVADKYPDQFDNILRRVSDTGRKAAYYQGETITLADLASPIDKKSLFAQMDAEIDALPKDKDFKANRRAIFQKYNQLMEKLTADAALKNRNNISMAVLSGARGKSPQLKAMVTSPGTYSDYKGEPIDVFSRESFAEGINPTTFAASSYGTRASVISTKCLAGDTLVVMADGSEKEIRNIKTGEIVLGADVAGKLHAVAVCNVFDQGEKPCFEYRWEYKKPVPVRKDIWMSPSITTRTYETIKVVCTQDHKFLCADGEVKPPVIGEDSSVKEASFWAMSLGRRAAFLGREYVGPVHCYDIEVDHPDHLFVLANGLITSNSSTAKGGDWAKQMAQVAADMVVRKEDCGSHNGLSLDIDDSSLKGRVLAQDAGPVKAGTLLTKDVINALRKQGIKKVEARSTLTCGVHNGVCSKCIGKYYNGGKWAKVGQHVGVAASSALAEPVCLVKGTEVRMADGSVKKIEDIEPGEYVLGSDMHGYCKPTRVVNKFHNGPRNCYRSYIKKGYGRTSGYITLESTAEHKILGTVRSKTVPLYSAELNIAAIGTMPKFKSTVRLCQSITGSEGGDVHEPMAMLLGMLIGDGSYKGTASGSAKNAVRLSCYDDEQVEILRKELEPLGLLVKAYTTPNEYRIVEADQYNTANWTAIPGITHSDSTKIRNRVRAKLIEEGMWGQDCYTKTLPKSIWSWDMDSVCKFVGGLVATDGYITKQGIIGYSSNNVELLKQIKELLQFRLGVYSSNIRSSRKKKPDGTYYNPTYRFAISEATNVRRFAEMIAIPGRKDAILTAAAEREPHDKRRGLYKLEKQEWLGVQDTWDLEVDNDTHLFALANGLIVSNTQMALCLSGDTKVPCCLETGNRFTYTKLKDIEPGMRVVGCDRQGQKSVATVLNKFVRGRKSVRDYYIEIYPVYAEAEEEHTFVPQIYSTGLKVRCTADHKFLCADGEIRPIGECLEGSHVVLTSNGDGIVELASEPIMEECYDIEIDHPDHLFLLANGLITSNSAKHTAGMTQAKRTYSGLDVIQQFTQSPEKFKDEGTVATLDGKVDRVEEAPQGGMYVTVKGKKHYILPGHEVEVKEGDTVEAGDQLAEGLVDPEDIVKYKGLGAGRKYWAERLNKILADSGAASDKRNTELMARAAIRHVRVTDQDGMGDYLPDDVVDYNALQASYKPSETTRRVRAKDAVGSYLQTPVMHYTIGTRITPKVAKELQENGHNEIDVDDKEPGFTPEMIRLRTASHSNPDWLASMGTSYLTKQLNEASVRGDDTNVLNNPDWRPRLAYGAGFGKNIEVTGEF